MANEGGAGKVKEAAGRRHDGSHVVQERLLSVYKYCTSSYTILFTFLIVRLFILLLYANPSNKYIIIATKISNNDINTRKYIISYEVELFDNVYSWLQ